MKIKFKFLGGLFLAVSFIVCSSASAGSGVYDEPAVVTFQLNHNRGSWNNDAQRKKTGTQQVSYASLSYIKQDYGILFMGSYAETTHANNFKPSNDFHREALLDSIISTFYNIDTSSGYFVRLGIDFNIPTGSPGLSMPETDAIFSDDIFTELMVAPVLGTGFNAAPNIAVSKQVGDSTVLGGGVRYEITGEYDVTSDWPKDKIDYGDFLILFGSVQHRLSDSYLFSMDVMSIFYTRDSRQSDDETAGKIGDQYLLNIRLVQYYASLRVTYELGYGRQGKDDEKTGFPTNPTIQAEPNNSNGDQQSMLVSFIYTLNSRTSLTGFVGQKIVRANGYDPSHSSFDGGFREIEIGAGFIYNVSDELYLTANIRMFSLLNKQDANELSDTTYRAFFTDVGFVYTFPE